MLKAIKKFASHTFLSPLGLDKASRDTIGSGFKEAGEILTEDLGAAYRGTKFALGAAKPERVIARFTRNNPIAAGMIGVLGGGALVAGMIRPKPTEDALLNSEDPAALAGRRFAEEEFLQEKAMARATAPEASPEIDPRFLQAAMTADASTAQYKGRAQGPAAELAV